MKNAGAKRRKWQKNEEKKNIFHLRIHLNSDLFFLFLSYSCTTISFIMSTSLCTLTDDCSSFLLLHANHRSFIFSVRLFVRNISRNGQKRSIKLIQKTTGEKN